MLKYSDLTSREVYRRGVVIRGKVKSQVRRVFLQYVQFLTECVIAGHSGQLASDCAMDALGTPRKMVVIVCSRGCGGKVLPRLIEMFPQCEFVCIVTERMSADVARGLASRYTDMMWIAGDNKLSTDAELELEIAWQNEIIGILKPQRALLPFRHAYSGNTTQLRYAGELYLIPYAYPHSTVCGLHYIDGSFRAPCETAVEYEEKMFHYNVNVRGGRVSVERGLERMIWERYILVRNGRTVDQWIAYCTEIVYELKTNTAKKPIAKSPVVKSPIKTPNLKSAPRKRSK